MAYMNYSMANATDFKFVSDTPPTTGAANPNYYTMADADKRDAGVSAAGFWKGQKYFLIASPVLNAVAGLLGVYLVVFNK